MIHYYSVRSRRPIDLFLLFGVKVITTQGNVIRAV